VLGDRAVPTTRRVAGGGAFGFEQPWSGNLSLRLDLRGEAVRRRQRMGAEPETIIDESYMVGRPNGDVTYITPAGLELFAGGMYVVYPAHTQKMDAATLDSETKYSQGLLFVPRFGLTRRGGFGSGGIYYSQGRETHRTITKSVGDGNDLTFDEIIYEPTTAALFAEFNASGLLWNLEVAAISGSEGGLRAANGVTMNDDHIRAQVGFAWAGWLKAQLAHQTAGYAKSAYMSLDNIPLSSARLVAGDAATGMWTGVAYLYGRDRQSIPELNAIYKVDGLVVLTGVNRAL
jgi:hypothetical protein